MPVVVVPDEPVVVCAAVVPAAVVLAAVVLAAPVVLEPNMLQFPTVSIADGDHLSRLILACFCKALKGQSIW